jgi:integrase
VDWQRNLIWVTNTKSGADRSVTMNETVKDLLIGLWREADRSKSRIFDEEAGPVSSAFHRLSVSAGLVDFKFHDLRHTCATRIAPHTDAFTLAALLGHKTLAMTARYTHPTDDGKRRASAAQSGAASKVGRENVTIEFPARASKAG